MAAVAGSRRRFSLTLISYTLRVDPPPLFSLFLSLAFVVANGGWYYYFSWHLAVMELGRLKENKEEKEGSMSKLGVYQNSISYHWGLELLLHLFWEK